MHRKRSDPPQDDNSSGTGLERSSLLVPGLPRTILVVLLLLLLALVFLVLTGIIAEPETLIEQILRAIAGS